MSAPLGMIPSAGTFAIRYHQSNAVLANLPTLADLEPQNRSALSGLDATFKTDRDVGFTVKAA